MLEDAKKYLPALFEKRALPVDSALSMLDHLNNLIQVVDESIYEEYMIEAQDRMRGRDLYDWPVVATALTLNSPLWTEDRDFFGSGIAVWTTDTIHLFLNQLPSTEI